VSAYRIDHEIGRGGMAVVYAGWQTQLDRPVALKVLASHLADDRQFRARFLREARIAARLHHPNLVRTFDVTELDGLPCIVMELVSGGTLAGGALTHAEAAQVAAGLAHAHAQGIVHRDLKPANVLRGPDGRLMIADFGVARATEETMVTQVGTVLGTPPYLSPEQALGRVVGPEADVYSLGVVLDELLVDKTTADRDLIGRCRAIDPAARPTAAEIVTLISGETLVARTRVLAPSRRSHRLTTRTALALVSVVAAAALTTVGIAATRSDGAPRIAPVPHAASTDQRARDLSAWLRRYSR
jgi:serine/threonine protein kinase